MERLPLVCSTQLWFVEEMGEVRRPEENTFLPERPSASKDACRAWLREKQTLKTSGFQKIPGSFQLVVLDNRKKK